MKKLVSLTVALLLAAGGTAHATTLDVLLSGGTISYNNVAGSIAGNINLGSFAGLSLNSNAAIITPPISVAGQATAPNGGVGLFGNSFLTVYGQNQGPNNVGFDGRATFNLAPTNNFGFLWGTVDSYNTIKITDSGFTYTLTGSDILAHMLGSPADGTADTSIDFIDPLGTIVKAVLTSSTDSFEVANVEVDSAAPLPSAVFLFGSALLGLGLIVARRRSEKQKI